MIGQVLLEGLGLGVLLVLVCAVVIRKEAPTPTRYPRTFAKIKKTPL